MQMFLLHWIQSIFFAYVLLFEKHFVLKREEKTISQFYYSSNFIQI